MQVKTGRFFAGLLLITAILGLIAFFLYRTIFQTQYPTIFPYMLGFFFLLNSLFYLAFVRIHKPGNTLFIRQFMILFGVKFLLYLLAAFIVILLFRKQALNIGIAAMVLYLFYTGYEVLWLTSVVKRKEHNK